MTTLSDAPLIQDVALYRYLGISKEAGNRFLDLMEANGWISPKHTLTGRTMLSFVEAEKFVANYKPRFRAVEAKG